MTSYFFVHKYIVNIDALFVLWFGLEVSLYYFSLSNFTFHLEQPAHVDCNKSAFTNFLLLLVASDCKLPALEVF